jgi:hypothetical protein
MFVDQLAQFFDLLRDHGLKIEDIPFAEERADCLTTLSVKIVTNGCAYGTWNSQGP